jgi:hypothetical protein
MPISAHDRGPLVSAPDLPSDHRRVFAAEPSGTGGMDYDPLAGGRGLVFGILLSAILLCGIVALAMLIWAT